MGQSTMGILDVGDRLSQVYSHLSCVTWGPTCRHYPWTRELALATFHDVTRWPWASRSAR